MRPRHIYTASIILWIALLIAHYIFRTHSILSGPREGDLYAHSWGFQTIVFLTFIFPFWLAALCAMIILEARYFHNAQSKNNT